MHWWLLGVLLTLSGCSSYAQFIDTLNSRNLSSCLYYTGTVNGGYGASGGLLIRGVSVTGGADLAQCMAAQEELR